MSDRFDNLYDAVRALHPHGRIRPDAIVVKGEVIGLYDMGCQTCLTRWPCPTVRVLDEWQARDVATGVNDERGADFPPHGADDAPDESKGAAPRSPASVVTPSADPGLTESGNFRCVVQAVFDQGE